MPKVKSVFLDFVRQIMNGDIDELSRRLTVSPSLATEPADVGAARQGAQDFFFPKSLIIFTLATQPFIWLPPLFGIRLQSSSLRTGRIAAPGIAAALSPFTTRRTPTAGSRRHRRRRSSTSCRLAQIPTLWIAAAWRLSTGRCERGRGPRFERCWMAAPTRERRTRPGQHPCISPFRPLGEEGAVPSSRASSRRRSSGCCWNAAQALLTKTVEADRSVRRPRVSGFEPCSSEVPADVARSPTRTRNLLNRGYATMSCAGSRG